MQDNESSVRIGGVNWPRSGCYGSKTVAGSNLLWAFVHSILVPAALAREPLCSESLSEPPKSLSLQRVRELRPLQCERPRSHFIGSISITYRGVRGKGETGQTPSDTIVLPQFNDNNSLDTANLRSSCYANGSQIGCTI